MAIVEFKAFDDTGSMKAIEQDWKLNLLFV